MRVALEPPPGLVSDDTTFSAEGRWADGNNVRFHRGKPQTIKGWRSVFSDALTGVCRNMIAWTEQTYGTNIAFGTHSNLQIQVNGALYDITPSGLAEGAIDASGGAGGWGTGAWGEGTWSTPDAAYYPRTWSLDTWGGTLVALPRGGTLYQWNNDPTVEAVAVTNAPAEITAMLVTPQRQVLAIGCTPDGETSLNPLCVRGCAIESITTWSPTSTNTAFEDKLEGGGRLITGRMVGDYVGLWSDSALYMGTYIGDPSELYRWQLVAKNAGVVGQNAVAVYKGSAFWPSPDGQFRAWTPGSAPEIIECPIRNDAADNVDSSQISKIMASSISQFEEIWWFYPDSRDTAAGDSAGENSRYVAVSVSGDSPVWFRGQIERTAAIDAGVNANPMAVSPDGIVYDHEVGEDADGSALEWYIQTADQYLNTAERLIQLQGIWPDFEDQRGDVSLTVEVRQHPQSTAVTKGPYLLAEGRGKRDFLATGRIANVKFSGSGVGTFARIGKPTFEAVVTGLR